MIEVPAGRPEVRVGLGGIEVRQGSSPVVGVRELSLGAYYACRTGGVGVASSFCAVADPTKCSVMLDRLPHEKDRAFLTRIANANRALCPSEGKDPNP